MPSGSISTMYRAEAQVRPSLSQKSIRCQKLRFSGAGRDLRGMRVPSSVSTSRPSIRASPRTMASTSMKSGMPMISTSMPPAVENPVTTMVK